MNAVPKLIEELEAVEFKRKPKKPTSSFIAKLNDHHITKQLSVVIKNSETIKDLVIDYLSFIASSENYVKYDVIIAMLLLAFIQAEQIDELNTFVASASDDKNLIYSSFVASSLILNKELDKEVKC